MNVGSPVGDIVNVPLQRPAKPQSSASASEREMERVEDTTEGVTQFLRLIIKVINGS